MSRLNRTCTECGQIAGGHFAGCPEEGEDNPEVGVGREELLAMSARSQELQRLLRSAGYSKGDGVSSKGQALVHRLAINAKIRCWSETETVADYDALIAVVRRNLGIS